MTGDINDEVLEEAVDELVAAVAEQAADETWAGTAASGSGATAPPGTDPDSLRADVAELRGHFEKFFTPRPVDFDPLVRRMTAVEDLLGPDEDVPGTDPRWGSVSAATNIVRGWDGRFAENLAEEYLAPLDRIRANHGRLAACLRGNAETLREVYATGRRNALAIARTGTAAVEAVTVSRGADLSAPLATALGPVPVTTPLLPATGGVELITVGIAAALPPAGEAVPDEKWLPLGSDTLEGVLDNVRAALGEAWRTRQDDEERARDAIRDTESTVHDLLSDSRSAKVPLVPRPPDISGAEHPSQGLGRP